MGLLSKLRAWLGVDERESPPDAETGGTDSDAEERGDDDRPDDQSGLDPTAAAEARTESTDDAVDALREVRRSRPAESAEPADGDADEAGEPTGDVDRDAP